jgi:hypothetical protein
VVDSVVKSDLETCGHSSCICCLDDAVVASGEIHDSPAPAGLLGAATA